MARVTHNLVVPDGEYIDKDGNEKKRWKRCGILMETDKGPRIKLDSIPISLFETGGWISCFPAEDRNSGGGQQQAQPQQQSGFRQRRQVASRASGSSGGLAVIVIRKTDLLMPKLAGDPGSGLEVRVPVAARLRVFIEGAPCNSDPIPPPCPLSRGPGGCLTHNRRKHGFHRPLDCMAAGLRWHRSRSPDEQEERRHPERTRVAMVFSQGRFVAQEVRAGGNAGPVHGLADRSFCDGQVK